MNHVHNFHYHKLSQTQLPQISVSRFQKKIKQGIVSRFRTVRFLCILLCICVKIGFSVILVKSSSSLADE